MPCSPDSCGRKPYPERKSCGFKNTRIRVDGSRIRKEKVRGFKNTYGYEWTEAVSGKKNFADSKIPADACGRKPYPERKSCGFKNTCRYVWTEAVSGKKKLRIQKYPRIRMDGASDKQYHRLPPPQRKKPQINQFASKCFFST